MIASMMAEDLASATFAVVDVETTGVDPRRDRVVEVACLRLARSGRGPPCGIERATHLAQGPSMIATRTFIDIDIGSRDN
jgi:DNA polymerase III alpha subunit (gram-positive type)